ncbi:hypothetical protein LIER_32028 [Lithospermum erythrorhizon]|uniref:Uncharacterized protein n=1 Tax=Lithospermum erythrorhizon TaxID=34254 RepID=A0AAV3RVV1_LITER
MGISSSCESTSVETSKVVLYDGTLQEFSYPVKVSFLMHKYPSCFICNSDDMEFNNVVSSMSDDETLEVGQLYFALPLRWLKRRMMAEEMAALAVKASDALSKCGCRRKSLFVLKEKLAGKVGDSNGGRGRRGKLAVKLNSIQE